jgi:hypothetical protein
MSPRWIAPLFVLAGIYDGLLGLAFLLFPGAIFQGSGVPLPHLGYVQFGALILLVFAVMFFHIARDPARNRALIPYGVGLKAAYSGTVFGHQLTGGIPAMWVPWAWADLGFLVLFLVAWRILGQGANAGRASSA